MLAQGTLIGILICDHECKLKAIILGEFVAFFVEIVLNSRGREGSVLILVPDTYLLESE